MGITDRTIRLLSKRFTLMRLLITSSQTQLCSLSKCNSKEFSNYICNTGNSKAMVNLNSKVMEWRIQVVQRALSFTRRRLALVADIRLAAVALIIQTQTLEALLRDIPVTLVDHMCNLIKSACRQ